MGMAKTNLTQDDLLRMKMHESRELEHPSSKLWVMRVPGGWIYHISTSARGYIPRDTAVFVPMRPEVEIKVFQEQK
jgi:hypothetical protein